MKLIVALGNPGKEYESTRHNTGFFVLDRFLKNESLTLDKEKFNGLFTIDGIGENRIIYSKPQTFMNLSGEFVKKIANFYKVEYKDILIITDDKDIKNGNFKIKFSGSAAGQNGIKNIIQHLATEDFVRLRVGIGSNNNIETKNYVLGRRTGEELKDLDNNNNLFNSIIKDFGRLDHLELMNKYN